MRSVRGTLRTPDPFSQCRCVRTCGKRYPFADPSSASCESRSMAAAIRFGRAAAQSRSGVRIWQAWRGNFRMCLSGSPAAITWYVPNFPQPRTLLERQRGQAPRPRGGRAPAARCEPSPGGAEHPAGHARAGGGDRSVGAQGMRLGATAPERSLPSALGQHWGSRQSQISTWNSFFRARMSRVL